MTQIRTHDDSDSVNSVPPTGPEALESRDIVVQIVVGRY